MEAMATGGPRDQVHRIVSGRKSLTAAESYYTFLAKSIIIIELQKQSTIRWDLLILHKTNTGG